jgi:hypothetical protein
VLHAGGDVTLRDNSGGATIDVAQAMRRSKLVALMSEAPSAIHR